MGGVECFCIVGGIKEINGTIIDHKKDIEEFFCVHPKYIIHKN